MATLESDFLEVAHSEVDAESTGIRKLSNYTMLAISSITTAKT